MRIYANQLQPALQKALTPIYLVSGDIPTLVHESIHRIRVQAKKQGFIEFIRYQVDSDFDWTQLANTLKHGSLFQAKQYIELQSNTQLGAQGLQVIQNYLEYPQTDKLLVIILPKLDTKTQQAVWVKKIIEKGTYVTIWPLDFLRYSQWIQSKIKEQGMEIHSKALTLLAEYTEGNYTAAIQTIEKLSLAFEGRLEKKIDVTQVTELAAKAYQYDVFEWADTCLSGNIRRMVLIFNALKHEYVEPTLILWTITQEIRQLIQVSFQSQHLTSEEAFQMVGIWKKKQPLFQKALLRHTTHSLESLLMRAHHIDKTLKGVSAGHIWDELLMLGMGLTSS